MRFVNRDELDKAKAEHQKEIEMLKKTNQQVIAKENTAINDYFIQFPLTNTMIFNIKLTEELKSDYEMQIKELKDKLENASRAVSGGVDSASSGLESCDDRSTSTEILSISNETGQKLRDQIELTKELDKSLIQKLNERQDMELKRHAASLIVPDEIKDILEKIDGGGEAGMARLSLSEILKLKTHLCNNQHQLGSSGCDGSGKRACEQMGMLNETALQNEKHQLIDELFKMRELLSQLNVSYFTLT
jgi:hypothetical protein